MFVFTVPVGFAADRRLIAANGGALKVNTAVPLEPPAGDGFETMIGRFIALSEFRTIVIEVLLTKVAPRLAPLTVTVEELVKPVPVRVTVTEPFAGSAVDGDRRVIFGIAKPIVSSAEPDSPPPVPPVSAGVKTVSL
jgi:hypothetical protein